jgi:hypothetical protein
LRLANQFSLRIPTVTKKPLAPRPKKVPIPKTKTKSLSKISKTSIRSRTKSIFIIDTVPDQELVVVGRSSTKRLIKLLFRFNN